jgi:hypothetical protein
MARGKTKKSSYTSNVGSVSDVAGRGENRAVAVTSGAGPFLLLGGSGYQAAGTSSSRGYLYWPEMNPRKQLSSLTRSEIARRVQWLYAHFGFARRLVRGRARLLGFLTPQPDTSDDEWNELAFDVFCSIAGSAEVWDAAGKFDFFQGQVQDNIEQGRDGDLVSVLTETEAGRARVAVYGAHQIRNGEQTAPWWVDGVRLSSQNKHLAYSLQDGEDPLKHVVVDARDAVYHGSFESRGHVRGVSILVAAVLNMVDVVEVRGFLKHGIKAHSRLGTVIEQDAAGTGGPMQGTQALGARVMQAEAVMPDGTTQPLNMEVVMDGAMTPALRPGQKVRVVSDDRPNANYMEFERALKKDCAQTLDLSVELLDDIKGITGPAVRHLNSELKRWIVLERYPQVKRCQRFFTYVIAKELKAGRLRYPVLKPGEMWWQRVLWIGLADMDIDGGRTAQATLTDLRSGQTTWADIWGAKGVFWKRAIKQRVREVIFAKLEVQRQSAEAGTVETTVEECFPEVFEGKAKAKGDEGRTADDADNGDEEEEDAETRRGGDGEKEEEE